MTFALQFHKKLMEFTMDRGLRPTHCVIGRLQIHAYNRMKEETQTIADKQSTGPAKFCDTVLLRTSDIGDMMEFIVKP